MTRFKLNEMGEKINPNDFKTNVDLGVTEFNKYGDNVNPQIIKIDIHDIDESEYNPRTTTNKYLQEIKESIADIGLQQLFAVTRNPKTKRYFINKGGNTRLEASKLLWRETGNPKYEKISCIVEPWNVDLDQAKIVISHLVENELRGDLNLTDKAKALGRIRKYYLHLLKSTNNKKVASSYLEYLNNNGYKISKSHLSLFKFTVDKLVGNLDSYLNIGLGAPQIRKIKTLYGNLLQLIKNRIIEEKKDDSNDELITHFEEKFKEALRAYNKKRRDFNFEQLKDIIFEQLIENHPLFLGDANNKYQLEKELLNKGTSLSNESHTATEIDNKTSANATKDEVPIAITRNNAAAQETHIQEQNNDTNDIKKNTLSETQEPPPSTNVAADIDSKDTNNNKTLLKLRQDVFVLAEEIAIEYGLQVAPINTGCGFILTNIFMTEKPDYSEIGVWWLLLGYSHALDMFNPNNNALLFFKKIINKELLPLYELEQTPETIDLIEKHLAEITRKSQMIEFRYQIIQSVKDNMPPIIWQKITHIESLCYQIIRLCKTNNISLWKKIVI